MGVAVGNARILGRDYAEGMEMLTGLRSVTRRIMAGAEELTLGEFVQREA